MIHRNSEEIETDSHALYAIYILYIIYHSVWLGWFNVSIILYILGTKKHILFENVVQLAYY